MDSQVEEVKARTNIVEVVGQYVTLRRAGRSHVGRCPFHKERTPSFHVSAERGTYKCFGCGEGGDVFSFVQKMDGIDFPTALKQLAEKAGVKLQQRSASWRSPETKDKEARLLEALERASEFFELELKRRKDVQNYCYTRGVNDESMALWRLGYAPASWEDLSRYMESKGFTRQELVEAGLSVRSQMKQDTIFDRFRGRIMFPLFDPSGKVIAFSGRFYEKVPGQKTDGEPAKYINSPETPVFRKSRALYGLNSARSAIRKADCILLVEGQFDVLLSHQSGLPFTVAISGTALTSEHLTLLGRLSKRLVLALDADEAGLRSGLKSAHMALRAGFDVKIPTFPIGQDPADLARENPELLKAAVRTSTTAIEYFLNVLWPTAKDERSYKKIVESQILPLVAALESRIDQEHFIVLIAKRLGVTEAAVSAEVDKCQHIPPREEGASPNLQDSSGESNTSSSLASLLPLQKKAGMLLFRFGRDSDIGRGLQELLGDERIGRMALELEPIAEDLRFRFDNEVGEHTEEATIAKEILEDIRRLVEKERFKRKFL